MLSAETQARLEKRIKDAVLQHIEAVTEKSLVSLNCQLTQAINDLNLSTKAKFQTVQTDLTSLKADLDSKVHVDQLREFSRIQTQSREQFEAQFGFLKGRFVDIVRADKALKKVLSKVHTELRVAQDAWAAIPPDMA